MGNLAIQSPWVIYYKKLNELFRLDEDIQINYDNEECTIKMYVKDPYKADALSKLLPETKTFGNVTLKINIIPANDGISVADMLKIAFRGNPVISYITDDEDDEEPYDGMITHDINYFVFQKEVVQIFADNLRDVNGVYSTLYQDIASEIFGEHENIAFCTDVEEDF